MKSASSKQTTAFRKKTAVAAGAAALGILATAVPALAQFPTSLGQIGATRRILRPGRPPIDVPIKTSYLLVSPYLTTFQFKTTRSGPGAGEFTTTKSTNTGPFFQIEKQFPLVDTRQQPSALAVGLWYWYHTSKNNNNPDRLGIYTQYTINRNISAQITLGGATRGRGGAPSGLFEYYGFLLYSPTVPKTSRIGVQFGVGPYIPRRSVGDIGYTYTLGSVYRLSSDYSLSASYWKVNYTKPAGTFGTSIPNDLSRANVSVVYNFK